MGTHFQNKLEAVEGYLKAMVGHADESITLKNS
jgi:hypothetical protein